MIGTRPAQHLSHCPCLTPTFADCLSALSIILCWLSNHPSYIFLSSVDPADVFVPVFSFNNPLLYALSGEIGTSLNASEVIFIHNSMIHTSSKLQRKNRVPSGNAISG